MRNLNDCNSGKQSTKIGMNEYEKVLKKRNHYRGNCISSLFLCQLPFFFFIFHVARSEMALCMVPSSYTTRKKEDDDKVLNCLSGTKIFGFKNHTQEWKERGSRKRMRTMMMMMIKKKLIEVRTFSYARFMFAKNFF